MGKSSKNRILFSAASGVKGRVQVEDLYLNDTFNGQRNFETAAGKRTGSAHGPVAVAAAATRNGTAAACATSKTGFAASVPPVAPATCMNGYSIIRKVALPAKWEEVGNGIILM